MAKRMTVKRAAEIIERLSDKEMEAPDIDGYLAINGCSTAVRIKAWELYDERCEAMSERATDEPDDLMADSFDEELLALWAGH